MAAAAAPPPKFSSLDEEQAWILEALPSDPYAMRFSSPASRGDRDFVLAAARLSGHVLKVANPSFLADREVALAAVRAHGIAFMLLGPKLVQDREIVESAIQNYGRALTHAAKCFKADREIVLAAVKLHGSSLQEASPELRNDREVVMEAVRQCGAAFSAASDALQHDREVALEAVAQDMRALKSVPQELCDDIEFLLLVAQRTSLPRELVASLGPRIRRDRTAMVRLCRACPTVPAEIWFPPRSGALLDNSEETEFYNVVACRIACEGEIAPVLTLKIEATSSPDDIDVHAQILSGVEFQTRCSWQTSLRDLAEKLWELLQDVQACERIFLAFRGGRVATPFEWQTPLLELAGAFEEAAD